MCRKLVVGFAGLGMAALLCAFDFVEVRKAADEFGLFVDGADDGAVVNDRGHVGTGSGSVLANVGHLTSATAPNRNEAVVFGKDRAPRRRHMPWTGGNDKAPLALGDRLDLAVTVWIVQGPFENQRERAIDASIETSAIWDDERMGIRFSSFDVKDATSDPDINSAIRNSTGGDNRNWDDFSNRIGFDAGRVNIYWINRVEGSTTMGWSDFGGRIVMGRRASIELLVHELGHAFSLRHPVRWQGANFSFDKTNVMWPRSTVRQYLTEGQVFRAHFNTRSAVNAIYGARAAEPTVACRRPPQTPECPALNRRLWTDGRHPPN